jgi:hypothetical protein
MDEESVIINPSGMPQELLILPHNLNQTLVSLRTDVGLHVLKKIAVHKSNATLFPKYKRIP